MASHTTWNRKFTEPAPKPKPTSDSTPLDFNAGPLVWIDCEMTGLDPRTDVILEIAVVITNGNLEPVDEGIEYVIRTDKAILDSPASPHTKDYVSRAVLEYIQKWVPEARTAVLAGNSVHADRAFLVGEMPAVVDWLHYRIVDVSSIKELCRRWYPSRSPPKSLFNGKHRALDDIKGSIRGA
ncbi:ribonuclease H-like domain-containing protein [Hygrophoropsis aurantiaca]|uniref:Ribonuclease H-like domain-containing protein n=1 Tax=Hygrophoropsis aurantiaca TaxID=72124 RepID=A0ACB8AE74_9AGAM|nr:ribonuclease H-like domain-containing protein [Hygrophoropsis aurantiaca]